MPEALAPCREQRKAKKTGRKQAAPHHLVSGGAIHLYMNTVKTCKEQYDNDTTGEGLDKVQLA